EPRGFARENDRHAQLEKPQAVFSHHASQLLRRFTIKRRLRIDENPQQSRLIIRIERVERELHAIREKLLKLRFNRIIDPAETAHGFAVARGVERKTGRALRADGRRFLHALDFRARPFNPLQFIDRRYAGVAGSELRVQAAEASPLAQVALGVIGAKGAGVLQCEFQRHAPEYRADRWHRSYRSYTALW